MLTFRFISFLGLMYRYSGHPCGFFGPRSKQSNDIKASECLIQFSKVHLPVRVLEAAEFTADEVNFVRGHSHRLSVL